MSDALRDVIGAFAGPDELHAAAARLEAEARVLRFVAGCVADLGLAYGRVREATMTSDAEAREEAGEETEVVRPVAPVTRPDTAATVSTVRRWSDTTNHTDAPAPHPPPAAPAAPAALAARPATTMSAAGRTQFYPGGIRAAILDHLPGTVAEIRDRICPLGYKPGPIGVELARLVKAGRVRRLGPRPSRYEAVQDADPEAGDAAAAATGNGRGPGDARAAAVELAPVQELILEVLPASAVRVRNHVDRRAPGLGDRVPVALQGLLDHGLVVEAGQPRAVVYRRATEDAS